MSQVEKREDLARLEENVRVTVAHAALRKLHGYVAEAESDAKRERKALKIFAAIVIFLLCVVAAMIAHEAYKAKPQTSGAASRDGRISRLEREVERQWETYQRTNRATDSARRSMVGANVPQTDELKAYVDRWVQRVEKHGTENYPKHLIAKGIHGSLLLVTSIRADGSIETVEVRRSSGNTELDGAAIAMVKSAAPFESFPPATRGKIDVVDIARTFRFSKEETNSEKKE